MRIRLNERAVNVDEGVTVEEVRRRMKPEADVVIHNGFPVLQDAVLQEGDELVLIRRGEQPDRRELEFLLTARHTPGVHARVKKGKVAVAGLGGLGSAVAVALARTGIGALILTDFDVVEPSNLNRQQYFLDQVGMPKARALADNLQRINPCVELTVHTAEVTPLNACSLFAGADVVVEAFDRAEAKAMLIDAVLTGLEDVPVVAASGLAGFGPADRISTRKLAANLYVVGDEVSEARPGEGLMAPRVGVAAHHQANAVLRLLLGEEPADGT